jgi:hypothetical protein
MLHAISCLIYSSTLKMGAFINVGWVSTDEKGVMSKKPKLLIPTAVRTLNPKKIF